MNLFFRLIYIVLAAYGRSRLPPLEASRIGLRVWLNDLDIFKHVNNGRYLTLMDLGRVDLLVRTGLVAAMRRRGWTAVVAAATVNYKRPLKFWQRFEMVTRIVGWDEKSVYMQQEIIANGKLIASSMVRMMMRDVSGTVPAAEIMAEAGHPLSSPSLPPVAVQLSRTEIAEQNSFVNV